MAGGVQLGYNDLSEDSDPRGTFLVSNTFADGKVGALLSLAYTKRNLTDEGSSTVRWMRGGTATTNFGALDPTYTGTATARGDQQRLPSAHSALRPVFP